MTPSMKITSLDAKDIRFPTSLKSHGSDAMHPDPDYSCAYVTVYTDTAFRGYGLTFTLGRGTEIGPANLQLVKTKRNNTDQEFQISSVIHNPWSVGFLTDDGLCPKTLLLMISAIKALAPIVVGRQAADIFNDFAGYWRKLTSDSQLRWLGPEKGVMHLATAGILNALWDLWARIENKPLWKLLSDMSPELLVSTIDFRYITDTVSKEYAVSILRQNSEKEKREQDIKENGYPAYTTQVGWIGYSDEKIKLLCRKFLNAGFTGFKMKVGNDLEDDRRRSQLIRNEIGQKNYLMMDANQKWDCQEAVRWMSELAASNPLWIEEPTSPDDIIAHQSISRELKKFNINVATGEMCSNRIMFKQFLQTGAMQHCQVDSCRLGSVNELLAVYFLAHKFNVPVCPHAGGVGLCQMVQHLQYFDYICLSKTIKPDQFIEYVDEEHEHFVVPLNVANGKYIAPVEAGYGVEMKAETIQKYEYPNGTYWSGKT